MSAPRSHKARAVTCAKQVKVLAEPNRLRIVEIMLREGPKHVNELQDAVGLEQSLVSYHLRVLRDAGVVQVAVDGKSRLYSACTTGDARTIDLGCCGLAFDALERAPSSQRRRRSQRASAP